MTCAAWLHVFERWRFCTKGINRHRQRVNIGLFINADFIFLGGYLGGDKSIIAALLNGGACQTEFMSDTAEAEITQQGVSSV